MAGADLGSATGIEALVSEAELHRQSLVRRGLVAGTFVAALGLGVGALYMTGSEPPEPEKEASAAAPSPSFTPLATTESVPPPPDARAPLDVRAPLEGAPAGSAAVTKSAGTLGDAVPASGSAAVPRPRGEKTPPGTDGSGSKAIKPTGRATKPTLRSPAIRTATPKAGSSVRRTSPAPFHPREL